MWVISLTFQEVSGTILVKKGGFLQCPYCGNRKLLRVAPTTEARALPVYCRKCSHEILIDIHRGQCSRSPSPDDV